MLNDFVNNFSSLISDMKGQGYDPEIGHISNRYGSKGTISEINPYSRPKYTKQQLEKMGFFDGPIEQSPMIKSITDKQIEILRNKNTQFKLIDIEDLYICKCTHIDCIGTDINVNVSVLHDEHYQCNICKEILSKDEYDVLIKRVEDINKNNK